jgi:hypothetical protein
MVRYHVQYQALEYANAILPVPVRVQHQAWVLVFSRRQAARTLPPPTADKGKVHNALATLTGRVEKPCGYSSSP